jgi:1,4-alpha-glucan branching enzyme
MGDPIGQTMQRLVKDANTLRRQEIALRAPGGRLVHFDEKNHVIAFIRYGFEGDRVLVVVNASEQQSAHGDYRITMANEGGTWTECFNSQAEVYGGHDVVGNASAQLEVRDGHLAISLPHWSVLMFRS